MQGNGPALTSSPSPPGEESKSPDPNLPRGRGELPTPDHLPTPTFRVTIPPACFKETGHRDHLT